MDDNLLSCWQRKSNDVAYNMLISKTSHVQARLDIQCRAFWNYNSLIFLHGSQKVWSVVRAASRQPVFFFSVMLRLIFGYDQAETESSNDGQAGSKVHVSGLKNMAGWHPLYRPRYLVRLSDSHCHGSVASRVY